MRVFKNSAFAKFARTERLSDDQLCAAVHKMMRGLIDADLGGGVIKQRVARPGGGESGGYRTILALRMGHSVFFIFGFAKNKQDNVSPRDLGMLKDLAASLLSLSDDEIETLKSGGKLVEIECHGQA